tara:strand:- start:1813 stop:2925 length:1113 start_codon:yes stop_codon:yes gene_type:complete
MKMLPISFIQTKFVNPINILKAFLWFLIRGFQLRNNKKYEKIYLHNFNESEVSNLLIPEEVKFTKKIENDTLILIKKFKFVTVLRYLFSLSRIRLIDKNFFLSSEASTRLRFQYYDFSSSVERDNYINLSVENFKRLKNLTHNKIIGILGTGPSYEIARDYFKENNLEIVSCNSSIYDDELWNTGCKIFCFADPVFHFGTSSEAYRFKEMVIRRFNENKFYIICPIAAFPILSNDWKIDTNFIIGLQPLSKNFNIGENTELFSPNTSNVLTEFMFPVAALVSKKIYLGGFDGRDLNEKNFWKYSEKTVQTLDEHKENHPSFFNDRNINKYYKRHVSNLSKQINDLEKEDYQIYNVTKSNIDILNERIING